MKLYSLSEGLKRARKEAGLTQAELTEVLKSKGIVGHIKTVMNWEQGRVKPSFETLMDLTELYQCDLDYLTGRIDCKTHDLQYIHDQTGLTETAIKRVSSLPESQTALLSALIEHPSFTSLCRNLLNLSDKETISSTTAALIIKHMTDKLSGQPSLAVSGDLLEKSMLYSLSTLFTNMVCDITDTKIK